MKSTTKQQKRKTRRSHTPTAADEHDNKTRWKSVPLAGLYKLMPLPTRTSLRRKSLYDRRRERQEKAEWEQSKKIGRKKPSKRIPFRVPTNQEQASHLQEAVRRHGDRRNEVALRKYRRGAQRELAAMNPWAGDRWAGFVEVAARQLAKLDQAYMITAFDTNFDIAFGPTGRSTRRNHLAQNLPEYSSVVRRRLRGIAYLLQLDAGFHRSPGESARYLSLHWHGIAFGSDRKLNKALARFPHGFAGAPGGKKKKIYDLGGALRYGLKDTRCGYVTFRSGLAGPLVHRREHLHGPQRIFLLDLFDDWAKPELCIGAGIGADILKRAKRAAERRGYPAYEGQRLIESANA